jgi:hypothetical protein
MTTMTIHADDALAAAIRKGAAEAGLSISKFIQTTMGTTLGVFKRSKKPLPDFFDFGPPLSHEAAEELRSVQKDFEVVDEDMWK